MSQMICSAADADENERMKAAAMPENAITISIANMEDADELAALGRDTFVEAFGTLYAEDDLSAFLAKNHNPDAYRAVIDNPEMRVWIARTNDGRAVGFASGGPCHLPVPNMPPRSGELVRLYILKSHQGAGLGVRLLDTVLDFLEASFDEIFLSVFSENFGAQRLYTRYGFEKVHDYHFMVGSHADAEYVMQRTRFIRP